VCEGERRNYGEVQRAVAGQAWAARRMIRTHGTGYITHTNNHTNTHSQNTHTPTRPNFPHAYAYTSMHYRDTEVKNDESSIKTLFVVYVWTKGVGATCVWV